MLITTSLLKDVYTITPPSSPPPPSFFPSYSHVYPQPTHESSAYLPKNINYFGSGVDALGAHGEDAVLILVYLGGLERSLASAPDDGDGSRKPECITRDLGNRALPMRPSPRIGRLHRRRR